MAGPSYSTHGISILVHKIMEPSLREISHILNNGKLMMDIVE